MPPKRTNNKQRVDNSVASTPTQLLHHQQQQQPQQAADRMVNRSESWQHQRIHGGSRPPTPTPPLGPSTAAAAIKHYLHIDTTCPAAPDPLDHTGRSQQIAGSSIVFNEAEGGPGDAHYHHQQMQQQQYAQQQNRNGSFASFPPPESPAGRFSTCWGAESCYAYAPPENQSQKNVMSIVCAIIIVLLIIFLGQQTWILVEPYSLPLCGAVILSVAWHEDRRSGTAVLPVVAAIGKANEWFVGRFPKVSFLSPLTAAPVFFHHAFQTLSQRVGTSKYPAFKNIPHVMPAPYGQILQNVIFVLGLVLLTARMSYFLFPQLLTGVLFAGVVLLGVPLAIGVLLCWFLDGLRFVRVMKMVNTVIFTVVIGGCFTISIVDETQQSGRDVVRFVQGLGVQIPDNAAELATSYFLSKNTTDVLLPAVKEFRFNGTWTDVMAEAKSFATNHTTTLSAAFTEAQPGAQGVGILLTSVFKFLMTTVLWSLGKVYEIVLFSMTLSTLLSLDRTVLYYVLKKVLNIVLGDEHQAQFKAAQTEARMITELSSLFFSLWHVFVRDFLVTLAWYSVFSLPLGVFVSALGGILALFPLTLPPMITQFVIGFLVQAMRQQLSTVMVLTFSVCYVATLSINVIEVGGGNNSHSSPRHPHGKKGGKKNKKDGSSNKKETGGDAVDAKKVSSSSKHSSLLATLFMVGDEDDEKERKEKTEEQQQQDSPTPPRSSLAAAAAAAIVESNTPPLGLSSQQKQQNKEERNAEQEGIANAANTYLVTTSIILGLSAHGAIGVVIGPIVVIAAHALFDAF